VSEVIRVLAVVAIIGYVIGRQLMGEPLRGKRVVLLPVILAVAGAVDLGKHGRHVEPADVVFLVISGLIAVTIGLLQGRMIRLECRNGALWGQMPVRALWLWALLVGSRLIVTVIALAVGAKVAGSSAPIIIGHPGTGPADYVPHGGGAAPDLAMLARLAGEWLAARRQRGR
jgi:hypothetical protein